MADEATLAKLEGVPEWALALARAEARKSGVNGDMALLTAYTTHVLPILLGDIDSLGGYNANYDVVKSTVCSGCTQSLKTCCKRLMKPEGGPSKAMEEILNEHVDRCSYKTESTGRDFSNVAPTAC